MNEDVGNGLTLEWSFGFNKELSGGIHSLSDVDRNSICYSTAHTGIIYDYSTREQILLQGHCNPISSCIVSNDKKWIATGDKGIDSLIVVWDSITGTPVKTIFNPHKNGVESLVFSPDSMFIASLGSINNDNNNNNDINDDDNFDNDNDNNNKIEQEFAIWEWTSENDEALFLHTIPIADVDPQHFVEFNKYNTHEIITNGDKKVIFWTWEDLELHWFSPILNSKTFRHTLGQFTCSTFLPGSTQAFTVTTNGEAIIWDSLEGSDIGEKNALKIIKLCEGSINFIDTIENYIVIGSNDGSIRFFDYEFRIEAWFEDINAGPITSISFSLPLTLNEQQQIDQENLRFWVPDFIVGTSKGFIIGMEASIFEAMTQEERSGTLLLQGLSDEIHGVATHPSEKRVAICSYDGSIQLWDYELKLLLNTRIFDSSKYRPQCLAYSIDGNILAIGMTSGVLYLLRANTLDDYVIFRHYDAPILNIIFSDCGKWMSCYDADSYVGLYEYDPPNINEDDNNSITDENIDNNSIKTLDTNDQSLFSTSSSLKQIWWNYIGRHRSHTKLITGLSFGQREENTSVLFSVGEDRKLVEYDLNRSSFERGFLIKGERILIEQFSIPTTCTWHPKLEGDFEDRIITANNEYKIKQWNLDTKACRSTTLSPTFGGPINNLILIKDKSNNNNNNDNDEIKSAYMVYSTHEKVIGLIKAPFDGNPNKSIGLIAHPGEISCISVSYDGNYLITAGGSDMTINIWKINTNVLDSLELYGGNDLLDPYMPLLDEGKDGILYNEAKEYFYLAQLRSQGESSTEDRKIKGTIPLSEIGEFVRALGFYPTEREIEHMMNEIKYSKFTQTGEVITDIDFPTLLRLYINHRPVLGLGKNDIEIAFENLGADHKGRLSWAEIKRLLKERGEIMTDEEIESCLLALVGEEQLSNLGFNAEEFSEKILGFEDFDDNINDDEY